MDDVEFEAQKTRIKPVIDVWIKRLGLRWWRRIDIEYHRDGHALSGMGHPGAAAVTHVHWEYKDAEVYFDVSKAAGFNDDDLEYMVVHELMHIFLQQVVTAFVDDNTMTGIQGEHVERTATELAQAFIWVRDFERDS